MKGVASEELVAQNVADYSVLLEGVEYFLKLQSDATAKNDFSAFRVHYEQHPEDGLCHIYRPPGRQLVLCRRTGIEAIRRIARRLVSHSRNPEDLSAPEIAKIISENIFEQAMQSIDDDKKLTELLFSYIEKSREQHSARRYHFPCVLSHSKQPVHFCVGPVSFTKTSEFIEGLTQKRAENDLCFADEILPRFEAEAKKHGWVASVGIPSCALDVSHKRAEDTIETAIGILKVLIGLSHSKGMRLPHVAPIQNRQTYFLIQNGKDVSWTWYGPSLESALVPDHWYAEIPEAYKVSAAHILHASTLGRRSEIASRVIDAIRWFGDASFEVTAGVQIAKWIAALERLTTTGNFDTHVFSKRVALLACEDASESAVADAYRRARTAYQLRCDVMHGTSQHDARFLKRSLPAHDLTRIAISRGLLVHCALDDRGKSSKREDLIRFFVKKERQYTNLFRSLKREYAVQNSN